MSLLLDALKKAAEQKARQAEANPDSDDTHTLKTHDDTVVSNDDTITYRDRTESVEDDTDLVVSRTDFIEDNTDIIEDHTLEVTNTVSKDDITDVYEQHTQTVADEPTADVDDTHLSSDETVTFAADDSKDETLVNESDDYTVETGYKLSETEGRSDTTVFDNTVVNDDATELTQPATDYTRQPDPTDDTQATDILEDHTAPTLTDRDVTAFMGDDTTAHFDQKSATEEPDDDLSLLLAQLDDTTRDKDNDTITGGAHLRQYTDDPETENLSREDYDRTLETGDRTATSTSTVTDRNETVTTGIELESLRHEHTIIRPDATSTHTYAPDNYDRTLIRPPSKDVSKIFAGMKAEEDVLMTPDYAKRVFLSKSTANRVQHYKVYLGIAVSILLAVGIYSMFELMDEYNQIDTAMLPLKRDPMPGIIQKKNPTAADKQLTQEIQPEVDTQTLKILQNAQLGAITEVSEDDGSVPTDTATVADQASQAEKTQASGNSSEQPVEIADKKPFDKPRNEEPSAVQTAKQVSTARASTTSGGNLQISTSNRIREKDQWLADAYAAYQRGDDETALRLYSRVLERDPSNRNALLARAAIDIQNGNIRAAIGIYQQLLLANPKDSLAMSSLISVARAEPRQSETQLKLMLRDEPDSPYLNFVLANIYGAQNRWQEAQGHYFKALENNPDDPNYAYNLAVSLEHMSKPGAAITYYERAIANIGNGLATFDRDLVDNRIEMLRQL